MRQVAELETITPERARKYLAHVPDHQRPINWRRVWEYGNEMSEGRWLPTSDAIAFDDQGNLINGQHRLRAVIESHASVSMLVVRGLPSASYQVTDCGQGRTVAQRYGHGCSMFKDLAAVYNAWMAVEFSSLRQMLDPKRRYLTNYRAINAENAETLRKDELLRDVVRTCKTLRNSDRLVSCPAYVMMVIWRLAVESPLSDWRGLAAQVIGGCNLRDRSPEKAFRQVLGRRAVGASNVMVVVQQLAKICVTRYAK